MNVEEDEPPSGTVNQFGQYQHCLGLYQCLSSWLWASRSRDRLVCLVSDYGEYRRQALLEAHQLNR